MTEQHDAVCCANQTTAESQSMTQNTTLPINLVVDGDMTVWTPLQLSVSYISVNSNQHHLIHFFMNYFEFHFCQKSNPFQVRSCKGCYWCVHGWCVALHVSFFFHWGHFTSSCFPFNQTQYEGRHVEEFKEGRSVWWSSAYLSQSLSRREKERTQMHDTRGRCIANLQNEGRRLTKTKQAN